MSDPNGNCYECGCPGDCLNAQALTAARAELEEAQRPCAYGHRLFVNEGYPPYDEVCAVCHAQHETKLARAEVAALLKVLEDPESAEVGRRCSWCEQPYTNVTTLRPTREDNERIKAEARQHFLICSAHPAVAAKEQAEATAARLREALGQIADHDCPYWRDTPTMRAKLCRGCMARYALDAPPTNHSHPRPCSICRREDCTTEHACE